MDKKFGENLNISRVHLDITGKCNLSCKHCHMADFYNVEPSYNNLIKIIKKVKKSGIKRITLSGGEPFIRKDITQIIEKCPKEISILTNATLIDERILKRLKLTEKKRKEDYHIKSKFRRIIF